MSHTSDIIPHLKNLFQQVRETVIKPPPEQIDALGRNAKGDQVKWFDLAADRVVRRYLEREFPCPVRLLSEEGASREFGRGAPEFTMVLDPVDGSENFARGISPSGTAIALIPAGQPVNVSTVQYALVGRLFTGKIWTATRGKGAFFEGRQLHPPTRSSLSEGLVSFDTNRAVIPPPLARLLSLAAGARSFAAAAVALVMVAGGTLVAHLDLTGNLTPENFLASALIISEAGGLITDPLGRPLPDIDDLTQGYQVLAAATPNIHAALAQELNRR